VASDEVIFYHSFSCGKEKQPNLMLAGLLILNINRIVEL